LLVILRNYALINKHLTFGVFQSLTLLVMRRATTSLVRRSQRQLSQAVHPPLQITTLPNKIRVATESTPGHFSSVGLYVDAGSRYEDSSTSGVSHFLDRMAFKVRSLRQYLYQC
jgi:processing peptidase subunit alpha